MNNNLQNSVNSQAPQESGNGINPNPQQKSVDPFAFQKALRTYELDVAESLKRKKTSVAHIAIAETVQRQQESQPGYVSQVVTMPQSKNSLNSGGKSSRFFVSFIKIVLVLALVGGGGYVLYTHGSKLLQNAKIIPQVQTPTLKFASLLPGADQKTITFESVVRGQEKQVLSQAIQNADSSNKITEIIPIRGSGESLMRVPIKEILASLNLSIPENLVRNILPQYFIGFTTQNTQNTQNQKNSPVIILRNNFFQNAYAGMLAWEPNMYRDLGPFFESTPLLPTNIPRNTNLPTIATSTQIVTATSTLAATSTATTIATTTRAATSTPQTATSSNVGITFTNPVVPLQIANPVLFRTIPTFSDKVYKNLDVRVLSRAGEAPILIYTFIDNDTIIITDNEAALQTVLETLDNTLYTR